MPENKSVCIKLDVSSSDALLLASICRLLSQNAYHCAVKGFSNYTLDLNEGTGATNPNYPMTNQLIAETISTAHAEVQGTFHSTPGIELHRQDRAWLFQDGDRRVPYALGQPAAHLAHRVSKQPLVYTAYLACRH